MQLCPYLAAYQMEAGLSRPSHPRGSICEPHHFADAPAGRVYVAPEVCANRPIRSSTQRAGYSPKLRSERVSFLSATMAVAITLLLLVARCECGIVSLDASGAAIDNLLDASGDGHERVSCLCALRRAAVKACSPSF